MPAEMTERALWIKYLGRPKPSQREQHGPCGFCRADAERRNLPATTEPASPRREPEEGSH